MANIQLFFSSPSVPFSSPSVRKRTISSSLPTFIPIHSNTSKAFPFSGYSPSSNHRGQKCFAMGGDPLGEFGARDPFPAEIESGFAEKVLGNCDTDHKILIPNISAFSLAQQKCSPISPSDSPMSNDDAQKLLKKLVGWRVVDDEGGLKIQCLWRLRDFGCGVELINRIYKVAETAGHYPNLHLEQPNQVRAVVWTASLGGLSMNDFILAAKIDEIKTSDLVPKKRIWA